MIQVEKFHANSLDKLIRAYLSNYFNALSITNPYSQRVYDLTSKILSTLLTSLLSLLSVKRLLHSKTYKMGSDLPLFARLNVCACATLGLTIAEYLVSHYTHSITLLVCANQSLYNLLSLIFGAVSIAVSISLCTMNP